MFSESYIIFSVGNIKQLQQWAFPDCYNKNWPDQSCGFNQYLGFADYGADTYVQIIGIIVSPTYPSRENRSFKSHFFLFSSVRSACL